MDLLNEPIPWFDDEMMHSPPTVLDSQESSSEEFGPTPPHTPEYIQHIELTEGQTKFKDDFEYEQCSSLLDNFEDDIFEPQCRCQQPIVRDCMWSTNFAVMLPEGFMKSSDNTQDIVWNKTNRNIPVLDSCGNCAGIESNLVCVDTRTIFNLPLVIKSPVKRQPEHEITSSNSVIEETVCTVKPVSNYGLCLSDDDFEVDVECLSDYAGDDIRIPSPIDSLSSSSSFDSAADPIHHSYVGRSHVMPAVNSASARVAAMHNYSQLTPPPSVSTGRPCSRSYPQYSSRFDASCRSTSSAPQSPANSCSSSQSRGVKRASMSNPPSPLVYATARKYKINIGSRNAKRRKVEGQRYQRVVTLSPPGSDSEGEVTKRAQHNVLERKRRNNLKEYFNLLRDHVPPLKSEARTSKVVILQGARTYVTSLQAKERLILAEQQKQIRYQEELKQRLSSLTIMKNRQAGSYL